MSSRRGPSPELLFSVLNCSVDAVISSVHGQITVCSILSGGGLQDGEREGWRRLCSDLLLHKEDYLFINVSIWTFAIFGCLSSLTHCINLMRFKSKYIKAEIRHKCYFPGVVMNK